MLTLVTLTVPEFTSCPSAGGHFPKLIAQFFEALDYAPVSISGSDMQGPVFLKHNSNNKNLHALGKLKVQDQKP